MKSLQIALEGNWNLFIIHPLTLKESLAVCRELNGFLIEKEMGPSPGQRIG